MHKILILFFVSVLGFIAKADETVLKGYVYKVPIGGMRLMSYKDYLEVLKNKDYKDFIDKVDECIKKEDYSCLSKYGNLRYQSEDSVQMYSVGLVGGCDLIIDKEKIKECYSDRENEIIPIKEKIKDRESGYRFVLWKVFQEVIKHKDRCSFVIGKNEKIKEVAGFIMYCKVSILKALPERIQKLYKQYGKKKDFDDLQDEVMVYNLDLERKELDVFEILNRNRGVPIETFPVQ